MMKVTVTKYLNVRVGEPRLNAPCYQYLAPGSELEVEDRLYSGDLFDNSDQWLRDEAGNYYWAGGTNFSDLKKTPTATAGKYPWWIQDYNIQDFWAQGIRGAGIKIAILDSGVNSRHPALDHAIKKNTLCTYRRAYGSTPEGVLDDLLGHGTACVGMISAFDPASAEHCTGVAPGADIFMYKVYSDAYWDKPWFIASGIEKAIQDGADIISISRGVDRLTDELETQFRKAYDNNIFVIAAAGNKSNGGYNALCDATHVIGVGAINEGRTGSGSSGENINGATPAQVTVYAPGIGVTTTDKAGGFSTVEGTSYAAPYIAGLFALKLCMTGKPQGFYGRAMRDFDNALTNDPSTNFKLINPQSFLK